MAKDAKNRLPTGLLKSSVGFLLLHPVKAGSHVCPSLAACHRSFPLTYSRSRARSPSRTPILAASSRADPLARPQIGTRRRAIYRAALLVVLASPAPTPLPASSPSRGHRLLSLLPPPRAAAARCRHVQAATPCRRRADEPLVPSSAGAAPAPYCCGRAAPTRCPPRAGAGCLDTSRGT